MKIEVGKFYRTRDGRLAEVVQLIDERLDPKYPYHGLIDGELATWNNGGKFDIHGDHRFDLMYETGGVDSPASALRYIVDHEWVVDSVRDDDSVRKWLREFIEVAKKGLGDGSV